MQQDESKLDADAEIKIIQDRELNQYLQELDEKQPLFSNSTQRIILLILDIVGLAIFIVYCYYIQSYLSTIYFLVFLIIIHSTWESEFYKIGMFETRDSDKKIFKNPDDFLINYQQIKELQKQRKTIVNDYQPQDEYISEQSYMEEEIEYKPLYWILFKDQKKKIWMFLLFFSTLSLIVKGVFIGIIKNDPSQAINLMTIENYEGIEIYFTLYKNNFVFDAKDYVKIFLPNSLIFIFCCFVMALRRVNNKKYFEEFGDAVNKQIFSFYFVVIWMFLAIILITNQSIIGYILFSLQLIVGLRFFQLENSLTQFDTIVIKILKIAFYIILVVVYFAGTPYIIQYVSETSFWPQFFGLDVMYGMRVMTEWNSYAFMATGLLLFTFLCIVSESLRNEKRKKIFKEAIQDCTDNYEVYQFRKQKFNTTIMERQERSKPLEEDQESEDSKEQEQQFNQENELKQLDKGKTTRMSHVDQGEAESRNKFLEQLNTTILQLGNKFTSFVDQPIVTLRILQLLIITIVIMQQTYESLLSVIWVMITGYTLKFEINSLSSLILALPSVIVNFLVFYYQCIPNMDLPDNPYKICKNSPACEKIGFFNLDKQYKETINILVMNITIYTFFLFLRQVNIYSNKKLEQSATKQIQDFIDKSQAKKKIISWWTIIFAISLKASYVVSLVIVYWIGFFDVNLIQFILVLFLLIFIINDSTLCIYKQKNEKTGEMQEYVVPFSFKYWVVFLTYICIITFLRYIYILFFRDQFNIASDKQWIISLIGINNQENYDILFWILFYFSALQYDSYRSKIYLRYSNKIVETILAKISNKEKQAKINTTFSTLYLLFMKTIIWITFTLNICFILFTPFSFINLGLFIFIGGFFVYYTNQFTKERVNYFIMSRCWYIYLNTLILAFIIRYIFQFICLPNYDQIINSNFSSLYSNLQYKYSQYGFYQYNQNKLRLEYFPDMVAIFFGAISLNTYQFFAQEQKRKIQNPNQQTDNPIDKPLLSSDSLLDQSGQSDVASTDKIEKKQLENQKQLAKIMQISILDEYQFLKKPIIFIAQINTDLLTIYVVFSVVFYIQSVASFIILVLYLSYFVSVHNELLNNVEQRNLLARLKQKITNLKKQYLDYNQKPDQSDSDTAEEIDLVQATNTIAMTRLKIRITKKVSIWKISFAFSCFCVFITYLSVYLSLKITSENQIGILNTQLGLFIFGTFAQEINSVQNCFCGKSDLQTGCINLIDTFQSTMFDEVLFYLILVFANVVDAGCTMFLKEQLQLEEENCKKFEIKFQSQKYRAQSKDVISRSMIFNLQGIHNQAEGQIENPEQRIQQMSSQDDELELVEFLQKNPFLTIKNVYKYNQKIELEKGDLEKIKIASLDINYYKNRKRIFNLNLTTAGFVALQRTFILILLLNTLLANNIFSLVYLGVATYLFLQKTGPNNIRVLNAFSVSAIWIQYIMIYFLNYELVDNDKQIPQYAQNYDINYFSVIYRASVFKEYPYFVPYLGFDNGEIMNCSAIISNTNNNSTNSSTPITTAWNVSCISNSSVEWIFILDTAVLSLIYLYFLLLQHLSKKILTTTIKMELDLQQTQSILQRISQNQKIEIHLNYQIWKNRVYSTLSGIIAQTIKISHIIIISIIILLAQSNRILLNYFEYILAIIFLIIFELILTSNRRENLNRERTYFKALFYLAVSTIVLYTILRLPWILNWCVDQTTQQDDQNEFICLEIFDMHIGGMIFILFFISLHFDLIGSEQFDEALKKFMLQSQQYAKMISRALAYHKNYKKFKAILQVQEQKAIFNLIQIRTQEKLKIWHAKLLDKTQEKQILAEEIKTEQKVIEKQLEIPESKQSEIEIPVSKEQEIKQPIIQEERKSQEGKQLQESVIILQKSTLTKSQKMCIDIIQTIQSYNNKFKFMSLPNIMDYLLSQNIMLKRRVQLPLSDFLQENYYKFEQELIFLDQFYSYLHRMLKQNPTQKIEIDSITEDIFQKLEKSQIQNTRSWKRIQKGMNILKMNSRMFQKQQLLQSTISAVPFLEQEDELTYEKYVKSPDLCFVNIYDDKQLIFIDNTKYSSALTKHSLGILIFRIFTEIFSLTITYWMPFCFLLIIFYYTFNSGIFGGVLPFLLFVWVLIDEKVQSKLFWIIAFTLFFFISTLIFAYTLSGVAEKQESKNQDGTMSAWYYPLYNGDQGLSYEVILMIFIIFQVNFAKNFGIYYQSLQDIENIFQGYVRMKLNRFNRFIRQQIVFEYNIAKKDDELASTEDLEQLLMEDEILEASKFDVDQIQKVDNQLKNKTVSDKNQPFQLKQTVDIERRIIEDPKVLILENSNLFQRIFSYKYSRPGVDLYPITASIQILILIYTLLFFTNMMNEQIKINNILKTNQIPNSLIWALLVEFIFMYFERLITMRDDTEVKGIEEKKKKFFQKYKLQYILKFTLQIITVVLIYWLVFFKIGNPWNPNPVYDEATQSAQNYANYKFNGYVECFFILYSAYFTVSALQLRFGYKKLKLRNTLLQSYNQISYIIANTYYAIPFLFELKVLMDWTFLETSLDVFQWFRLEDIQGIMYFTKNQSNGYLARPLGLKISKFMKCTMGCSLVLFIFLCIFGPLILFSSLNPATELNPVRGGEFQLSIINVKTSLNVVLYQTNQFFGLENTLETQSQINEALNQKCNNSVINNAPKTGELQEFQLLNFSNSNWDISYPLFAQLQQQLKETMDGVVEHEFFFNVSFIFTRDQQKIIPTRNYFQYPGNQNDALKDLEGQKNSSLGVDILTQLYDLTNCKNQVSDTTYPTNVDQISLPNFYLETIQLYSADGTTFKPKPIDQNGVNSIAGASLSFFCTGPSALTSQSWWTLVYAGNAKLLDSENQKSEDKPNGLIMFVVSDSYSALTQGFSIITIYTSVILLIGSFIRSLFSGQIWLLEYKGMVYPDDLLMICQAISIARSQKDYKRENMLYFELIDILRSPEIVKVMTGTWTKELNKKEQEREEQKQIEQAEQAQLNKSDNQKKQKLD